jgi:tetratricopeptide (TPR) repeat protein
VAICLQFGSIIQCKLQSIHQIELFERGLMHIKKSFRYSILFCFLLAQVSFGLPETDLKNSILEIEAQHGEYASQLIEPYLELARIYMATGRMEEALTSLRRAQHLTHRDDGVYAMRQLEIIDLVTVLHLNLDEIKPAEGQQQFALQISKHNTDENNPDLVPALLKLAQWQLETGQFLKSRSTLQDAKEIISSNFDDKDVRMVPVIRLEAESRVLQGICCAWEDLEEAKAIISQSPSQSDEYADLLFELGDAYILANKPDLAADTYRNAWEVVQQQSAEQLPADSPPRQLAMFRNFTQNQPLKKTYNIERDPFGYARYRQISYSDQYLVDEIEPQFFVTPMYENQYNLRIYERRTETRDLDTTRKMIGEPVQFDYKQLLYLLPLGYKSDFNLRELSIVMDFTVDENGKTSDVIVAESNAPLRLDRLMRRVVNASRFRPAFKSGKAVKTHHVKFTQTFVPFSDIISQHLPVPD